MNGNNELNSGKEEWRERTNPDVSRLNVKSAAQHASHDKSFQAFPLFFMLQVTKAGCGGLGTRLGDSAVRLLHMPLSMPTSLAIPLVLPSPLLHQHMTHSHIIISISMEVFAAFFFISSWPSTSKENGGGHHQHCIPDHHTPIQYCSQTHRSTECCIIVAISKSCVEAQGLQDQANHNLNSLHPRWNAYFHSEHKQVKTTAQSWLDS